MTLTYYIRVSDIGDCYIREHHQGMTYIYNVPPGNSVVFQEMRNYKRKTNRGPTPQGVMERAAEAVVGGQSVRSAAKDFAINRMTLKRYIVKRDIQRQQGTDYAAVVLRQLVFSPNMEKDLADHVKQLADMFHGLSVNRCCSLAYEFAKRNNLDVPLSWDLTR